MSIRHLQGLRGRFNKRPRHFDVNGKEHNVKGGPEGQLEVATQQKIRKVYLEVNWRG